MTFSPKELQFNEFRGFSKTIKNPFDLLSGICGRLQVFDGVLRVFVGVLRVKLVVGFHQILSPKPQNNIKCFPLHVGLQRSQPGHEQTNVFINFSFVVVTSMYLYISNHLCHWPRMNLLQPCSQFFKFFVHILHRILQFHRSSKSFII